MNSIPRIYQEGNNWQKKVYQHMSLYLEKFGVLSFGLSTNGNSFKHLLTEEQSDINFVTKQIHDSTKMRFESHKAGDLNRVLTNTAASQPYCFNLIIYLDQHLKLASQLFTLFMEKPVEVVRLVPEFTPNHCDEINSFERNGDESLGDQNSKMGTDADIAVFYKYDGSKNGVLLIEFKFIEAEFSVCSSYKVKDNVRPICDSINFHQELVVQKKIDERHRLLCGYNKYQNWDLTSESEVLDFQKIKSSSGCPFRYGLNQLWRNYLLAEKVAFARNCDEFGFWVFSPVENDYYLWKNGETEKQFRNILSDQGNNHFKIIHLESIIYFLDRISDGNEEDKNWALSLIEKYIVQ